MKTQGDGKRVITDRRQGDRRVALDPDYTGPERRKGDRRVGDRRCLPRA